MTVAPMVVSAATHGVNGVGIDYATGALTSLLAISLITPVPCSKQSSQGQNVLILGGPCSPQGQIRHVAALFDQIRHWNRNKTAKYVFNSRNLVGWGP